MIPGGLLGPVGGLEQVWFTSSEPMSKGSRFITTRGLSGRSHSQVLPRAPRSWVCEIPHDAPQEGHVIDQMEEWVVRQREGVTWYPADALGTNMLDPEASLMSMRRWTDMLPAGARVLPGETLPGPRFLSSGSTHADGTWAHLSNIPVPHQRTITASVYVTAFEGMSANFWLDELRLDGSTLAVHKATTTDTLRQLSFTFKTSPETVAVTFGVSRAAAVVAPQLTLTDHIRPWGVGRGCMSALVEVGSRNPLWTATSQHIYGSADATTFTITEQVE